MPELPDLLYIQSYLDHHLVHAAIAGLEVVQPVVLRNAAEGNPAELLAGRTIDTISVHGPFMTFSLHPPLDLVVNLMLAGRLQHQRAGERPLGHRCISLLLADGSRLNIADEQKMAKVYLVHPGDKGIIPKYDSQGVDILSEAFTPALFRELASRHGRKQVRVFINDQTILSAIGNAYADEILFEARIHPKTFVGKLSPGQIDSLHAAIRSVMHWAIDEVNRAAAPIEEKVRGHVRVRNRHGEPCPRCGSTIRREGVRGHDVYFCPTCQPASRKLFIDWNRRSSD